MRRTYRKGAVALVVSVMACAGAPSAASAAEAVYGLTSSNALVTFFSDAPGVTSAPVAITGLPAGATVVGIDVRPAGGQLYALAKGPGATANGFIYRLDPVTGAATLITSTALTLDGSNFGFDFDPGTDRIRIVSETTGQNLQVNPNTGNLAQADGALAYAAGDPNATGLPPTVSGIAYTNNVPAATTTQLFAIDRANGELDLQDPPSSGTLHSHAALGTPTLAPSVGFDISASGLALAVATPNGGTRHLYRVSLSSTPALSDVGAFPASTNVDDIAIGRAPATFAAVTAEAAGSQHVFGFLSSRPEVTSAPVAVTGLAANERIVGIDSRPATGKIIALTDKNRLYTLDPVTGVASEPRTLAGNNGNLQSPAATAYGVDVDPVSDALRVVLDNRRNVTIAPDAPAQVTEHATVAYDPLDPGAITAPSVVASGYTNAVPGATSSTLYDIDKARAQLVTQDQGGATDGLLHSVGSGLFADNLAGSTISGTASLDIVPGLNEQFAALQRNAQGFSELFAVNGAGNGQAALLGRIGPAGTPLVGGITALLPAPVAVGGGGTAGPGPAPSAGTPTPAPVIFSNPGTSGVPGVDKVAPITLVVANTLQAKTLTADGLSVLMFCNERCLATTKLLLGRTVIATGSATLTKADTTRFRLHLTTAGKARIRTDRNQRLALESVVVDAARNAETTRAALTALKTLPPVHHSSSGSAAGSAAAASASAAPAATTIAAPGFGAGALRPFAASTRQAQAADTTPPVALVVANGLQATTLRLNGLSVLYACDGPCAVSTKLLSGSTVVGQGTSKIDAAGISRFRFKLNAAGRRLIHPRASRRLSLRSTVTDPAGNSSQSPTALTVRRAVP